MRNHETSEIYPHAKFTVAGIFQAFFWGRISAPFPMEKMPIFSQKEDEISQSEAPQTVSNFSSF